jgi:hypothetical protein
MKLDYLQDGSDNCPLLRLYAFDRAEAQRLFQLFESLANGIAKRTSLREVESIDGTQLTLVCDSEDRGVIETSSQSFEIMLTSEGWKHVAEFTAPFANGSLGYQWLLPPLMRGTQLLLSKHGDW